MVTRNRDVTKRMTYFDRQFLRAQDFTDEQDYHIDRRRRHTKFFHSAGMADLPDGLKVMQKAGTTNQVTIQPGWAVDEDGREMSVLAPGQELTITRSAAGPVDIYISYAEPEPLSDPSTDPGVTGFTRVHEQGMLTRVPGDASSQPAKSLPLATVTVDSSGNITGITDRRQPAGIATNNILDDAISSAKIAEADGTTGQNTNQGSGVKEGHIQDNAVSASKLRSDANDANDAQRAVTTNHIRNGHVTDPKLADNAVSNRTIVNGAVTEPKLADDAVSTRTLQNGAVTAAKIAANQVVEIHLQNNAVTSRTIAPADAGTDQTLITGNGVKAGHLKDQAVTTSKLATNAVSADKLQSHPSDNAQRAVGKLHIQSGAVSIAQLSATLVFDAEVAVPAAPAPGQLGQQVVNIQQVDEHAFHLISLRYVGPRPALAPQQAYFSSFTWTRRNSLFKPPFFPTPLFHRHELVIQNPNAFAITVSCKAYRLAET